MTSSEPVILAMVFALWGDIYLWLNSWPIPNSLAIKSRPSRLSWLIVVAHNFMNTCPGRQRGELWTRLSNGVGGVSFHCDDILMGDPAGFEQQGNDRVFFWVKIWAALPCSRQTSQLGGFWRVVLATTRVMMNDQRFAVKRWSEFALLWQRPSWLARWPWLRGIALLRRPQGRSWFSPLRFMERWATSGSNGEMAVRPTLYGCQMDLFEMKGTISGIWMNIEVHDFRCVELTVHRWVALHLGRRTMFEPSGVQSILFWELGFSSMLWRQSKIWHPIDRSVGFVLNPNWSYYHKIKPSFLCADMGGERFYVMPTNYSFFWKNKMIKCSFMRCVLWKILNYPPSCLDRVNARRNHWWPRWNQRVRRRVQGCFQGLREHLHLYPSHVLVHFDWSKAFQAWRNDCLNGR